MQTTPMHIVNQSRARKLRQIWDTAGCAAHATQETVRWAFQHSDQLQDMKYAIASPSMWYMVWYKLAQVAPDDEKQYDNPYIVMKVAEYETQSILQLWNQPIISRIIEHTYMDKHFCERILSRKPFGHAELQRAQKLHIALSITRPMFMASKELKIANSMNQIQRKWLPDSWIAHLCAHVFKHFVNQILILERWNQGFVQKNIVFAHELHKKHVTEAMKEMHDNNMICIVSYEKAIIVKDANHVIWSGDINRAISAWIELSDLSHLRQQTRTPTKRPLEI